MLLFRSKNQEHVHVADLSGHVAKVGPEWTELPEFLHALALQKGCITATDSEIKAAEEERRTINTISRKESEEAPRVSAQDQLYDLLYDLSKSKNDDRSLLTAAGAPNVEKVNKFLGYNHKREDVLGVWRKIKEIERHLGAEDLPALCQLVARVRRATNDNVPPYLNDDDYLIELLNEGVAEAAERSRLIFEEKTPITTLVVQENVAVYQLDPSIFEIIDAWLISTNPMFPSNGRQLYGVDQTLLDDQKFDPKRISNSAYPYSYHAVPQFAYINWRNWKGMPIYFIQDDLRFQLVPIPDFNTQVYDYNVALSVYRVPFPNEMMQNPGDVPVINQRYHWKLCDWALYKIYDDFDGEMADPVRAAQAYARFEAMFGIRNDANVQRNWQRRTRRTVRVNW